MREEREKLFKAISLHGKAWLSIEDFVESVIPEKELESFDSEFDGKEFYPSKVIEEARKRLNSMYFKVKNDSPMPNVTKEKL